MPDQESEYSQLLDEYKSKLEIIAELEETVKFQQNQIDGKGDCKLISIPLHSEGNITVIYSGSCAAIRNFIKEMERTATKPLNCQLMVISGNLIPTAHWAPVDAFVYEPVINSEID